MSMAAAARRGIAFTGRATWARRVGAALRALGAPALAMALALVAGQAAAQGYRGSLRALVSDSGYEKNFDYRRDLIITLFEPLLAAFLPGAVAKLPGAAWELDSNRVLGLFMNRLAGRLDDAAIAEATRLVAHPLYDDFVHQGGIVGRRRTMEEAEALLTRLRRENPKRVAMIGRFPDVGEFDAFYVAFAASAGAVLLDALVGALLDAWPYEVDRPSLEELRADLAADIRDGSPARRERAMAMLALTLEGFDDADVAKLLALMESDGHRTMRRAFDVALGEAFIDATGRFAKALLAAPPAPEL